MNAFDGTPPERESGRPHARPTEITIHSASKALGIAFDDGKSFRLPFEFLRVYSPSAEVQGHGPGQERLQTGKRDVTITSVDTVGHYALQPIFSDGHDTGIYTWDYLYGLGLRQEALWADYLRRLQAAGASRDPAPGDAAPAQGCGHDHGEDHGEHHHAVERCSAWTSKSRPK